MTHPAVEDPAERNGARRTVDKKRPTGTNFHVDNGMDHSGIPNTAPDKDIVKPVAAAADTAGLSNIHFAGTVI